MVAINWNFVFIVVNLYHITIIIYEKRPVKMDDKNTELYQTLFKEMTPVEYLKISRASMGNNKTRSKNYNTRYAVPDLYLVYNGTVDVYVDNKWVRIKRRRVCR